MDAYLNAPAFAVPDAAGPSDTPVEDTFLPFKFLFGPRANLGILLVLFVLILGFASSLVALAHAYGATDPRSLEIYKLVGLCAIGLGQIAVLIRSQGNAEGIRKTGKMMQEVAEKTNGGLHKAVQEVATQVREAERDQVIADPKCKEAIVEIIRQTVAEMRDKQ